MSISDKMLFRSGRYKINDNAKNVIGKIAKIINDPKELDILVEGHTDNVPKTTNETARGRAINEILILPKLDQFFELLETPISKKK
ncbi:MAG: OmpA family protein [Algibacter sp.]|uniref:OmpA family protein n=1 Tax=Algibacter sp. TaxID=1872428 RepID=UPI0026211C87|nr:OmpA family protein [Algibacter sp.]MDG1729456.1 OmpA family protein [Algibacter sp.]MDG2178642.1 OmpA family protein [Algibacter sp.]